MATQRKARKPQGGDKERYTVICDLPNPLPITEWEIALLEGELADFLEELISEPPPRGSREV